MAAGPVELDEILELILMPVKSLAAESEDKQRVLLMCQAALFDLAFELKRIFQHPRPRGEHLMPDFTAHPLFRNDKVDVLRKPPFPHRSFKLLPPVFRLGFYRFHVDKDRAYVASHGAEINRLGAAGETWLVRERSKARLGVQQKGACNTQLIVRFVR